MDEPAVYRISKHINIIGQYPIGIKNGITDIYIILKCICHKFVRQKNGIKNALQNDRLYG